MLNKNEAKMKNAQKYEDPQRYFWEQAGRIGYNNVIFSNQVVSNHIVGKQNAAALSVAKSIGLDEESRILELGCGDGEFAEYVLSPQFKLIDAYDQSVSAIERARSRSKANNVLYHGADLTTHDFEQNSQWDGAFCIGFLHHVKAFVPSIVARLAKVTPKVVVLEPNGDNIIRKGLEWLPSYQNAGEDSFRLQKLIHIFAENRYQPIIIRRIVFVPSFCPQALFQLFKKVEKIVEGSSLLDCLCAAYVIGFQQEI